MVGRLLRCLPEGVRWRLHMALWRSVAWLSVRLMRSKGAVVHRPPGGAPYWADARELARLYEEMLGSSAADGTA